MIVHDEMIHQTCRVKRGAVIVVGGTREWNLGNGRKRREVEKKGGVDGRKSGRECGEERRKRYDHKITTITRHFHCCLV